MVRMVCVRCMHIAVWCVWKCKVKNANKNKKEYGRVRIVFKETNNKRVVWRDA